MSHMEYFFETLEALTKTCSGNSWAAGHTAVFDQQVIGTVPQYINPDSLAARINILMRRASQLCNLPQGKVSINSKNISVTKVVLIVLLTSLTNAAYFFRQDPSLKFLTDLGPFHPQFLLHIHLAKRFENSSARESEPVTIFQIVVACLSENNPLTS